MLQSQDENDQSGQMEVQAGVQHPLVFKHFSLFTSYRYSGHAGVHIDLGDVKLFMCGRKQAFTMSSQSHQEQLHLM